MAGIKISQAECGRFYRKKYALVCALLDCEAFKSWHTPSRSEWCEALTAIKKMVRRHDWPLYEVIPDDDDASSTSITNTGLMLNGIHELLVVFDGHDVRAVPSPQQWGNIMRVVDETAGRRAAVDEAARFYR